MKQRKSGDGAYSARLFALCFMAYSVIYIGRKNFSACMPGMISDGVIDKLAGGAAGTAFLAVYACGQLINGLIGDRINPKYMISGGLFGAASANILMGLNSNPVMFAVIWGFNGYFCSMLWSSIVRCISEWIDEDKRSSAGVKISMTIPLGAIASYLICALFLHFYSWRIVFIACGSILGITSVIFFLGLTSLSGYISEVEVAKAENAPEKQIVLTETKGSMRLSALIISTGLFFAVAGILFNGILKDGLDLWVPSFISEYFNTGEALASTLTAILPVINLSGVFIARLVNDRITHNEISTCSLLFAVSTVSFIPLIMITASGSSVLSTAVISVVLISVTSSTMLGINSMFLTFIPFRFARIGRSSSITGFLNSCSYMAAALSGIIFGFISDRFGWAATIVVFAAVSVMGGIVCALGIVPWRNGSERLNGDIK